MYKWYVCGSTSPPVCNWRGFKPRLERAGTLRSAWHVSPHFLRPRFLSSPPPMGGARGTDRKWRGGNKGLDRTQSSLSPGPLRGPEFWLRWSSQKGSSLSVYSGLRRPRPPVPFPVLSIPGEFLCSRVCIANSSHDFRRFPWGGGGNNTDGRIHRKQCKPELGTVSQGRLRFHYHGEVHFLSHREPAALCAGLRLRPPRADEIKRGGFLYPSF